MPAGPVDVVRVSPFRKPELPSGELYNHKYFTDLDNRKSFYYGGIFCYWEPYILVKYHFLPNLILVRTCMALAALSNQ